MVIGGPRYAGAHKAKGSLLSRDRYEALRTHSLPRTVQSSAGPANQGPEPMTLAWWRDVCATGKYRGEERQRHQPHANLGTPVTPGRPSKQAETQAEATAATDIVM